MKKILVSLISDHTIPNILAVQRFKPDEMLFISTPAMEKRHKTLHILNALAGMGMDFQGRCHTVSIMEDSILDCHRKLDGWMTGREDGEYIVNLTCGTKIMSIAAFEYFKDYGARMIYIPFPKNEFITPFPKRHTQTEALTTRLKVAEYLAAYGLSVINARKLDGLREEARNRFELSNWITLNYGKVKNLLVWFARELHGKRDDRQFLLTGTFSGANSEETSLLKQMDFCLENGVVSKTLPRSEIQFLTGGWLEEYCFNEVSRFLGKGVDDLVMGIKVKNEQGADNEFDLMFTCGNALYTVECKSLDQHDDPKAAALYKIGALNKDFGLKVKSFFVSTSPYIMREGRIKPSVEARAAQFNTTVITPDKVLSFADIIAEKLGFESRVEDARD